MRYLITFALVCIFSTQILSTNYYVDAINGNDNNPGTSTSKPWKSLTKVNSAKLYAGDQILFKRNCLWLGTIKINYSGTAAAPIVFGDYGSGNLPIISGNFSSECAFYMQSRNNIIIQNLNLVNMGLVDGRGAVFVSRCDNITVQNLDIYLTGRAGVFIQYSTNCKILNNRIKSISTYLNFQTDGIYSQKNTNIIFDGNNIVIANPAANQHNDCIQVYQDKNDIARNNYVEQLNYKTSNAQGLYFEECSGTTLIYNNVAVGMYTKSSLIKFKNPQSGGFAKMLSNTVYGGEADLVQTNDPNIIFHNNIVQTTSNQTVVRFDEYPNKVNVNNNLYKNSTNGKNLVDLGSRGNKSLTQWKALGYDVNSLEVLPSFANVDNKDFSLTLSSPAINKGKALTQEFAYDFKKVPRPKGSAFDIGAFEFVGVKYKDPTEVGDESHPSSFTLRQNYPNPFNPSTNINFAINHPGNVRLIVFDALGKQVSTLVDGYKNEGEYSVVFNAEGLASGVYFYSLTIDGLTESKKMTLMK